MGEMIPLKMTGCNHQLFLTRAVKAQRYEGQRENKQRVVQQMNHTLILLTYREPVHGQYL
jgi:hypothetical protein